MKKRKWILIWTAIIAIPFLLAFISLPNAYFLLKPACKNELENTVLHSAGSTTIAYQAEVIRMLELKKPQDFRYFFRSFLEEGEKVYLLVNFRNQEQCFDAIILVEKWDKLAAMKKTNGVSYPEELYELEWKIEEKNGKKELVYQNMHSIID